MKYLRIVIYHWAHNKSPYTEKLILDVIPNKREAAKKAYYYAASILHRRWPEGEHKILASPYFAYLYAKNVIKKRWPEAEPIIAKEAESAYLYAKYILKAPFKAAEENKKTGSIFHPNHWDLKFSYRYARHVSKKRLKPSIEKLISESSWSGDYAKYVVKGRWKAGEEQILKSTSSGVRNIGKYVSILSGKDKSEFHNRILIEAMQTPQITSNMRWVPESNAKQYIKELERVKAKEEAEAEAAAARANAVQNGFDQSLQTKTQ